MHFVFHCTIKKMCTQFAVPHVPLSCQDLAAEMS